MATFLLSRVGDNLWRARSVCEKLRVCGLTSPDEALIEKFCDEAPSDSVADYLLLGNKRAALKVLEEVHESDYSKIIGYLDARLEMLSSLNASVRQHRTMREIAQIMGKQAFLAERFMGVAKFYEPRRVNRCRQYMAVVDDAVRSGAREGTLELLINLW